MANRRGTSLHVGKAHSFERNTTRGASFSVAVQQISAGGTRKKELSETGAWLDARHGILHWQCSQAWACDGAASRLIDTEATIRCTASAFADADAHAHKRRRAARAVLQDEVRKHWAAGNPPRDAKHVSHSFGATRLCLYRRM